MGTILLVMAAGLTFGLIVFFICEEKSLKNADFSDMKGLFTQELQASAAVGQFQTVRYLLIYLVILLVFDLVIANLVFLPNEFALREILAYTFIPSLVGSWIILLVKWTYQPVIKLASSFMYGAGFIGASSIAFAITYLIL